MAGVRVVAAIAMEGVAVSNKEEGNEFLIHIPPLISMIKVSLLIKHKLHDRFNLPTEGLEKKFPNIQKSWKKNESNILKGLEKITGLFFVKDYDIYLIDPNTSYSISKPIIIGTKGNSNKTVRVIIHELIHNLMLDNSQSDNWSLKIQTLFPKENKKTAIHIAVHAILEAVYVDILKQSKEISKDIEECKGFPDYKRAWEIVKKEGYQSIISQLKNETQLI